MMSLKPIRRHAFQMVSNILVQLAEEIFELILASGDCLGTFCDTQYSPSICSPKKIEQALGTGANYMTIV
jgi:hypothetical protein